MNKYILFLLGIIFINPFSSCRNKLNNSVNNDLNCISFNTIFRHSEIEKEDNTTIYELFLFAEKSINDKKNNKFKDSLNVINLDFGKDSLSYNLKNVKNCLFNDSILLIRNILFKGIEREILIRDYKNYFVILFNQKGEIPHGFYFKIKGSSQLYYLYCVDFIDYGIFFNGFTRIKSISKINPKDFSVKSSFQLYENFVSYKISGIVDEYYAQSMSPIINNSNFENKTIEIDTLTKVKDLNLLFNSYGSEIGSIDFNGNTLEW